MTDIVIAVHPAPGKPGQFNAHVDGRHVVTSTSPFVATCRALIAQGADPDAIAVMRHAGGDLDALRGRLAAVAAPAGHATPRRRKAKPATAATPMGRISLRWQGTAVFRAGSNRPAASIVVDAESPFVWHVRGADGLLSDGMNLARAKAAAEHAALQPTGIDLKGGSARSQLSDAARQRPSPDNAMAEAAS